jgi:tRNA C32,U32 (ribose-2'-O)-methylase TrmJ
MSIRIVLVDPAHPGNIGAAARAMKNMGLKELHLVRPRYFPNSEATARASGAEDVLEAAHVHESFAAFIVRSGRTARMCSADRTGIQDELGRRRLRRRAHGLDQRRTHALQFAGHDSHTPRLQLLESRDGCAIAGL